MCPEKRLIRSGEKQVSDTTDPDYVDKRVAKLIQDYKACPDEWKSTFIAGLDSKDFKEIREQLGI